MFHPYRDEVLVSAPSLALFISGRVRAHSYMNFYLQTNKIKVNNLKKINITTLNLADARDGILIKLHV